jgi:hypothetical protein
MPVVIRILDNYFVCADRVHAVVDAVPAASGLAFDVVERPGMNNRTTRPGGAGSIGSLRDFVQDGRAGAEGARRIGARSGIAGIISGNDPRAGDRVLAQFHRKEKENTGEMRSQPDSLRYFCGEPI